MSTDPRGTSSRITRLTAADAIAFRNLRLNGLREHPDAFGASWEDEAAQSEAQFSDRLESAVVFGVRSEDGTELDGIVGLYFSQEAKINHKAILWGMYVSACKRGSGIGSALLNAAIFHATTAVEEVKLTVGTSNASAYRLYNAAGFRQYGIEQRALKVGDRYYDEALMSLVLPRA
ncbi:GNAT family N-acetyltransferase [Methylobacterium bullatum]|uniref:GNAT family N-acetyltransferase n=1 Tax=Methylobacterium bullatum TaxID=570505 RepID=UPI001782F218|nr:GNAT family protein [Methylobacterium bullatum]MBD8903783.1 GNAT family N-acetyltransferase [Methylobacterium bullatum]